MTSPDTDSVRCPTCRARQPWSDTCRRCQSDLRLLREFVLEADRRRLASLGALRAGDLHAAWSTARAFHALTPCPASRRLLAVTAVLRGDRATAIRLARRSSNA